MSAARDRIRDDGFVKSALTIPPRTERNNPWLRPRSRHDTPRSSICRWRGHRMPSESTSNGVITAMAGASRAHNRISGNIYRKIADQLENRQCEAFVADMRLCVSRTGLYTYPDVMAVCGGAQFLDQEVNTLLNPSLIVEVLSRTTESYDRGVKFGHYRQLHSLQEYVLASQEPCPCRTIHSSWR